MTVNRRVLVAGLLGLLGAPLVSSAQGGGKVWRLGWLSGASSTSDPHNIDAFRQGMSESGWSEGRNITIEYRWSEGDTKRLAQMAEELVRLKVDVIIAPSPGPLLAAKNATQRIPIVMVFGPDPIQAGLVTSLARPGGNITGLTSLSADLSAKQLELLRELVPAASNIGVLWNPSNPWHQPAVKVLEQKTHGSKVRLHTHRVSMAEGLEDAIAAMAAERAGAMLVLADPMTFLHRRRIADLAVKYRLPMMSGLREYSDAGALASYWPNSADSFRRAASYVNRIISGVRPGDLPIEQPTTFEFVINLKTARALGLTIPPSLLLRADEVIE